MSDGDTISNYLSGEIFKSNMSPISEHVYAVGNTEQVTLTKEQQDVLHCNKAEGFYRLFSHGVMYHSIRYASQKCSKRNNTFFEYKRSGTKHFGQIVLFIKYPRLCALIRQLVPATTSLMQQIYFVDHPVLKKHQKVDILNSIMPAVSSSQGKLICVELAEIAKKAVLIKGGSNDEYISSIPNSYEHH